MLLPQPSARAARGARLCWLASIALSLLFGTASALAQAAPSDPSAVPAPQPAPVYGAPPASAPPPGYAAPQPAPVYVQPAGYPPPAGAPMYYGRAERPRISRGLMIGGISVLGGSYLFSALVGALVIDYDETECTDCQDVAPWLFLPVVGPFVGATKADGGAGVFVLLGAVQVVGTGLLAGGIVRFKRTKRRAQEAGFASFALPHGMRLAVDMASSPRFSGPELTLRF